MHLVAAELSALGVAHRFVLKGDIQDLLLVYPDDTDVVTNVLNDWESGNLEARPKTKHPAKSRPFIEQPAHLTLMIVFVCCVGAALAAFGTEFIKLFTFWDPAHRILFALSGFDPWIDISTGQYWRLLTPIFLHFGPVHLIFNGLWFWYLGTLVERHQSYWVLLTATLVIALTSNIIQAYFSAGAIFGGLSGVVYGLFSYVWLTGKLDKHSLVQLPDLLFVIITVLMVLSPLGVLDIIVNAEIADAAHISGYISGALLALSIFFLNQLGIINFGSRQAR